jgi:hypothetical protein
VPLRHLCGAEEGTSKTGGRGTQSRTDHREQSRTEQPPNQSQMKHPCPPCRVPVFAEIAMGCPSWKPSSNASPPAASGQAGRGRASGAGSPRTHSPHTHTSNERKGEHGALPAWSPFGSPALPSSPSPPLRAPVGRVPVRCACLPCVGWSARAPAWVSGWVSARVGVGVQGCPPPLLVAFVPVSASVPPPPHADRARAASFLRPTGSRSADSKDTQAVAHTDAPPRRRAHGAN